MLEEIGCIMPYVGRRNEDHDVMRLNGRCMKLFGRRWMEGTLGENRGCGF